jgi:murein L,D-transpeptidase YcbB/YkuD
MEKTPALACILALGAGPAFALPVTLPKGTVIELRSVGGFDSGHAKKGDRFMAVVHPAVFVGGQQAVPRAAVVAGEIKHVRSPRDGAKSAAVAVKFEELRIGDKRYDIEGVLTSLQADDTKKILEHQAKMATGRRIDVVFIGAGTEASRRASTLVGTSGADREDLADEWAASGLGPAFLAVAPNTVLAMRLDKALFLEETFGQLPEPGDRVIAVAAADVRRAQEALKARGLHAGPVSGELDEATRRAIARFQVEHGQPATGDLDRATLDALAKPR